MSEMGDFNKDFVKRTLELLENNYDKVEYEVTFLLNCLCGLVTFPIELEKENEKNIEIDIFKENCVEKLVNLCSYYKECGRHYKFAFSDIRNAIAHFNMKISNKDGKMRQINLKAYSDARVVLDATISIEKLKEFAQFVAKEYLKVLENES